MKTLTQIDWHELPSSRAAGILESDPAPGLTQAEVKARLRQFGPNQMTAQKRLSEWMRFLLQFHQPLTYLLLLNRLFHTAPVRAEAWLYIVAIGLFTFAAVELEKWLRFCARSPKELGDV